MPLPMKLLFPHGLGDVIQALPAFEALASKCGEQLDVGALSRLPACVEVLRAQPYVASTFGLDDPWNDFAPANTWMGFSLGMKSLQEQHEGATLMWTTPPYLESSRLWSKALRIAGELGVEIDPTQAPALGGLWSHEDAVAARAEIDRRGATAFAVVHGTSGNPSKDVALDVLAEQVGGVPACEIPVEGKSLAWHLGVIERASMFVGVDSGPAHLASCTRTPVVWAFATTPIEQAIPLWRDVRVVTTLALARRWERWKRAHRSLVVNDVEVLVRKEAA